MENDPDSPSAFRSTMSAHDYPIIQFSSPLHYVQEDGRPTMPFQICAAVFSRAFCQFLVTFGHKAATKR